jgi:hypothetical protein
MNKSKITIEYDVNMKKDRVTVNDKNGRGRHTEVVDVKDPKCWEVITVENTMTFAPGYRLTEKQVNALCKNAKYDVSIGLPGQFRVTNSRY